MIVVAYSGSSKTEWSLNTSATETITFSTEELNPIFVDNYTVVRALMTHFPNDIDPRNVTHVFFYGAGCTSQQHQQRIIFCLESFFEEAKVSVDTDLVGAAKGVFNDKPGLLAILGTNSSACAYDGSAILEKSTSLNVHIGNEGGGINIGTQIAKSYYYGNMPNDLMDLFKKETEMTQEELFNNLNSSESPASFLSNLVEFANAHKEHPFIKHLVQESFRKFIDLHLVPLSRKTGLKDIGIIGSVGFLFSDILQNELDTHKLQVEKMLYSPMQGLTEYHLAKP
jgi:N-acetylglucosamine kinase-like BadF-type ATPase